MTFKHIARTVAAALVAALILTGTAFAQSSTANTTLSAAVGAADTTVRVASATGFVAGSTYAYIDRELVAVLSVSGTTIGVSRGQSGTRATAHVSGSVVYVGPATAFLAFDPFGACTASDQLYTPYLAVGSGRIFTCNTAGYWQSVSLDPDAARFPRTEVVDAAYTAKIGDFLIVYTSITADRVVTLPSPTGLKGKQVVIKDESGLVTGNTTIGVVSASAGQLEGWASQIDIATAYSLLRLYSNGTAWLRW